MGANERKGRISFKKTAQLDAILENSPDAIISKTLDGTIISWNRAAEKIYGYSAEEIIGKNISILLPVGQDETTNILELIRDRQRIKEYETFRRRKNNEIISVVLTVSPIKDHSGRIIGASTIARDITKQKRNEADIQIALLNIFDDLHTEKEKLEDALSKLWKLNKMEETILNLGHELKSPLVPVKSQLQLLLDGDFGRINTEQRKSLDMILKNTDRLNHLVGDVTDIAKIESNAIVLVYEPISLEKIIREQARSLKLKSQEKEISVVVRPIKLPIISADRQRITEVITNLLDNAIKFSPPKSKVVVEAERIRGRALVRVIDEGIGIRKDVLKRLFVRFFQVDSSISRKYGGTGLGLSICKGIMKAHGGKIWAESEGEGRGSTFAFTIPLHREKKDRRI